MIDSCEMDYSSIKSINGILESYSISPTKKFGQNFLISKSARSRIADLAKIDESMPVWEIGPGLGALTEELLERGAVVTVFEIDYGFIRVLSDLFDHRIEIVPGNALETVFSREFNPSRLVGNLPYNMGSEIIGRMIEKSLLPDRMVFTLQKEVAERMVARPGSPSYSAFTVLVNIDYRNTISFDISPNCFYPTPNVESSVVVMERKKSLIEGRERKSFISVLHAIFSMRRKTIKNNLLSANYNRDRIEYAFKEAGLTGSERAEALSIEAILALSLLLN